VPELFTVSQGRIYGPQSSFIINPSTSTYHLDIIIYLLSSGNRTPGSRSYSDLVDTQADSVCIHQLVLKPQSKATCIMQAVAYGVPQ